MTTYLADNQEQRLHHQVENVFISLNFCPYLPQIDPIL